MGDVVVADLAGPGPEGGKEASPLCTRTQGGLGAVARPGAAFISASGFGIKPTRGLFTLLKMALTCRDERLY